jgi:hypothetical protein
MSHNRKLRRAQQKRTGRTPAVTRPAASPIRARHQLEEERFKTPGSEKLWTALLGWPAPRIERMWIAQAVHDGARRAEGATPDASTVLRQLAARVPEAAARLDEAALATAVELWARVGEGPDAAPVWQYIANLGARAGLGETTAEALEQDWNVWTNLTLAGAPRQALLEALAQTERAALALGELTRSEPVEGVANFARIAWTALAYGDEDTFERLSAFGKDWLARRK